MILIIKTYDIGKKVHEESKGTKRASVEKVAIIRGPKGIIVSDNEAVHNVFKNDEEKYDVYIYPVEEGIIHIIPTGVVNVSIKELEALPAEETELGGFIRVFGRRIENNYVLLLYSIREIGLDSKDFPRTKE